MSADELAYVHARAEAAGMTSSELVRQAVRRVRTWTAEDRQSVGELVRAVARVGVLTNQVARAANTAVQQGALDHATAERLRRGLALIDQRLAEIQAWRPPPPGGHAY